jgi:hypothetical protein
MRPITITTLLSIILSSGFNQALAGQTEAGLSISLQGIYGRHSAPSIDSGSYAPSLVDSPWVTGQTDISEVAGGKIKTAWTFASKHGRAYQLGLTYSGWAGNERISTPAYGAVFWEPSPTGGNPRGEITICTPETTCTDYQSRARREYWELMPELQMQLGNASWIGLKPFWGDLEESSYASSSLSRSMRVDNDLNGQVRGLLISGKKSLPLTEQLEVSISAAMGPYEIEVDSRSEGSAGGVVEDSKTISGFRGQLGIEGKYFISSSLSLDASMLLDYWSKQPFYSGGIVGNWGGRPVCNRTGPGGSLACEPPRAIGDYGMSTHSMKDLLFGLGLTYNF